MVVVRSLRIAVPTAMTILVVAATQVRATDWVRPTFSQVVASASVIAEVRVQGLVMGSRTGDSPRLASEPPVYRVRVERAIKGARSGETIEYGELEGDPSWDVGDLLFVILQEHRAPKFLNGSYSSVRYWSDSRYRSTFRVVSGVSANPDREWIRSNGRPVIWQQPVLTATTDEGTSYLFDLDLIREEISCRVTACPERHHTD